MLCFRHGHVWCAYQNSTDTTIWAFSTQVVLLQSREIGLGYSYWEPVTSARSLCVRWRTLLLKPNSTPQPWRTSSVSINSSTHAWVFCALSCVTPKITSTTRTRVRSMNDQQAPPSFPLMIRIHIRYNALCCISLLGSTERTPPAPTSLLILM